MSTFLRAVKILGTVVASEGNELVAHFSVHLPNMPWAQHTILIQVIIKQNLGHHSVMQINMPLGEGAGCYGLIQLPFIEISRE